MILSLQTLLIISTNAIALKIDGKQKDYCFTKTIDYMEDTQQKTLRIHLLEKLLFQEIHS